MDINNPIPQAWVDYVTQTNLGLSVVPGVLYSEKNFISGVTTKLTFFDFAAGARTDLTNMEAVGQLPNPESFLIQAIESYFKIRPFSDDSGVGDKTPIVSRWDDIVQILDGGVVTLKLNNTTYKPWPLNIFSTRAFVQGGFATGSDLLADYGQLKGQPYSLYPYMMISPLQPFVVTIEWPAGPITLSTGSESSVPLRIMFDGQRAQAIT
jgi:hypothetical protein